MGTTGEDYDYSGTEFSPRTGLIPRTVQAIFQRAEEIRVTSGRGASWECRLSFLELYNEEIIDLLAGGGASITVREENGRIVWSGTKEVKVKTLAEVMRLLQEGSERRQTGETGMNATSSRSHAIFSLTLVQKHRSTVVSSTSGIQSLGRNSPNPTLKRPNSMIGFQARSGTPSGSRQAPPTAFTPNGKTGGLPRPYSMQISPNAKDEEMVIVTSKFNMVDLAGSERLKRTAAQGDRMKEGISINSGLLALGNVISIRECECRLFRVLERLTSVADSVKAKGHIPYRDSKLTRMLQDSIGGNALTTMIACVSPLEYNIAETLNTIKYASRARNIKNLAKANQVEAGWDDVEHLQTMVIRLRKQIAEMNAEGGYQSVSEEGHTAKQDEKLVLRLAELQREHTQVRPTSWAQADRPSCTTDICRNATRICA